MPLDTSGFYENNSPLFIGHRGMLKLAPENTLPSYLAAIDIGFRSIEMDVVPTKDGHIICSHNFDLERETDGQGWIDDLEYNVIKRVKTGVHSHPDMSQNFNTLFEACSQLPQDIVINIEIKSHSFWHLRHAFTVARMVKSGKIKQPVIVSSFNPFVIWAIKCVSRKIFTALILEEMTYFWSVNLVHPDFLHPDAGLIDEPFILFCKSHGLAINTWTVNTIPAMQWLIKKGVNGIITDSPNIIKGFYET